MDTSTVLEKYTQDLSNLPLEVKHLLEEIKNKDVQLMEARKRYQTKDNQIHKFIRSNGTLTKHPKEQQLAHKIEEEMAVVHRLQKDKILLANTALFLISKHLFNFETDIARLERDELLPKAEGDLDVKYDRSSVFGNLSDNLSGSETPRNATPSDGSSRRLQKRKQNIHVRNGGPLNRPMKRMKSEEFEDGLKSSSIGPTGSLAFTTEVDGIDGPVNNGNGEDADNNLYCFCQRVSFGEMIGCDNEDCKNEWFHWSCVGITSPPKDDEVWYCPDCAPKMEKRKKKRKL